MNANEPLLAMIVGMSRGGTTWMSRCLSRHSKIAVFGESLFFGRRYLNPGSDGLYSQEQLDKIKNRLKIKGVLKHGVGEFQKITEQNIAEVIDTALPNNGEKLSPGHTFQNICKAIAKKEEKEWVIEKTPHHLNSIEMIMKYFPGLKIIAMSREPYGFMLSYKHQLDRQNIDLDEKRARQSTYHPAGCALVWKRYASRIAEVKKKWPDQVLHIDLSEIQSDAENVLERVQNFLGVPVENKLVRSQINTSFPKGEKPALKSSDYFWLKIVAGEYLQRYEAPVNIQKTSISDIVQSFILIPYWAISVIKHMKKETNRNIFAYLYQWIGNFKK